MKIFFYVCELRYIWISVLIKNWFQLINKNSVKKMLNKLNFLINFFISYANKKVKLNAKLNHHRNFKDTGWVLMSDDSLFCTDQRDIFLQNAMFTIREVHSKPKFSI